MFIVIVMGFGGLIGFEVVVYFVWVGYEVVGIENDMCVWFFGFEVLIVQNIVWLLEQFLGEFCSEEFDICDVDGVLWLFERIGVDLVVVIYIVV